MPYNPETEEFYQNPSTVVDSTPDGDSVKEGFDDRLSPAMTQVYEDINLLKATGMIGVGIPATTTGRGISRIADDSEATSGVTGANGPAFITPEQLRLLIDVGDYALSHNTSKTGFLICHGAAVSRTTYAALFAKIGTTFGDGDGSTTFNVPDFRGRVPQGASGNLGSVLDAGLPNIYSPANSLYGGGDINPTPSGALFSSRRNTGIAPSSSAAQSSNMEYFGVDASKSNSIYGNSATVQPPAIALNVFIKY